MTKSFKIAFFDRDGVLNSSKIFVEIPNYSNNSQIPLEQKHVRKNSIS